MPSDILGAEVIEDDVAPGKRHVRFIPGPDFAKIILADEINRSPPRSQAALLEAMQAYQGTGGGVRHDLDRPLFVLATENPIEQEGTYPLPEAQLDRFMFNVVIDYPDTEDERRILAETTTGATHQAKHVATGAELQGKRGCWYPRTAGCDEMSTMRTPDARHATEGSTLSAAVRDWVRWGVGPRAGQNLVLGAKAAALLDGRSVPSPDDVTRVALPVLRHRLLVNFQAEADGITPEEVIRQLLATIKP